MVMNARKIPRLNDGYFETKKSHHHYEDSMSKYSSKSISYANSNESSYKHRKNYSPSNESGSHSRSGTPDRSPQRTVYSNKSVYSQRVKDRDRERDKYKKRKRDSHSRSPQSSQLSESKAYSKSSNNNHSKSNDYDHDNCKSNLSKKVSVGDWTEHISSSGKRYYYHCVTEVSQWEKPKEWVEWERKRSNKYERNSHSARDRDRERSVSRTRTDLRTDKESSRNRYGGNSGSGNRSYHLRDDDIKVNSRTNDLKRKELSQNKSDTINCVEKPSPQVNDPVINVNEPQKDAVTITNTNNSNQINNEKVKNIHGNSQLPSNALNQSLSLSPSQVTAANLPQLISRLTCAQTQGLTQGLPNLGDLSTQDALRTLQQALQLTKLANTQNLHQLSKTSANSPRATPVHATPVHGGAKVESPLTSHQRHHHHHHQHYHHQHHYSHHQSADGIRQELDLLISKGQLSKSPTSEKSGNSSTKHESPPSSVTNMPPNMCSALKPSVPVLTPSLANYFRSDLISHVTGWQADHAEKGANRYSDESNNLGSHMCTRVSAELKMARSLVRLTEIQSTLQEQRILFATQQIKNVEDWRGHSHFSSKS